MSAIQFGWIGETSSKSVLATMEGLVKDWIHAWQLSAAPKNASVDCKGREKGFVHQEEGGAVLLSIGRSDASMLGRLLAAIEGEVGMGGSLAVSIGEEAVRDLVDRILRRAGISKAAGIEDIPWPKALVDPRLGSLICHMQLESLAFDIAVDRKVVTALVGKDEMGTLEPRPKLMRREDALHDVEISLEVAMDFGSTSLDHVTHLKVGDVLVADATLNAPALLRSRDGRSLASGVMTERAGKLAITLRDAPSQ